jgi:hypothetical protein
VQCCSVPNDASGWAALVERLLKSRVPPQNGARRFPIFAGAGGTPPGRKARFLPS